MSLKNDVAAVRSIVAVIRSLHLSHAQRNEKLTIARRLMTEAIGREYGLGTMDTTGGRAGREFVARSTRAGQGGTAAEPVAGWELETAF